MKLPSKLFVKIEDDGSGNEFFDPHISTNTMVDAGERAEVGVYQLVETIEVRGSVTVVSTKPLRKKKTRR